MPVNRLLRQLLNDERVIEKLAESKPIRTAAKAAVAAWHKGKIKVEDGIETLKNSELSKKMEEKTYTDSTYELWKKNLLPKEPKKKDKDS